MPLSYEATISCNNDKCKTVNLTSDPYSNPGDAQTDAHGKALADDWEYESSPGRLPKAYWCPAHKVLSKSIIADKLYAHLPESIKEALARKGGVQK